jgi:uncharacterized protein (TIGR03382 family)
MGLLLLGLVSAAHADIGPPPSCGAGTHHEYLYGHHCVRDGYHLVAGEHGGSEEVADTPIAPTVPEPVAPSPTPTPAPAPEVTPAPSPAPAPAPAPATKDEKGCATTPGPVTALLVGLAALSARRRG